uniref:Uncharacterized protein n=1 Tax=Romanomermis culicivorax TaxID=13658 RepID=A0A915HV06_ROMCU
MELKRDMMKSKKEKDFPNEKHIKAKLSPIFSNDMMTNWLNSPAGADNDLKALGVDKKKKQSMRLKAVDL